jgi:hypothetical protein
VERNLKYLETCPNVALSTINPTCPDWVRAQTAMVEAGDYLSYSMTFIIIFTNSVTTRQKHCISIRMVNR